MSKRWRRSIRSETEIGSDHDARGALLAWEESSGQWPKYQQAKHTGNTLVKYRYTVTTGRETRPRVCTSTQHASQQVASTRVQSHEKSSSLSAAPIATVRPLSDVPT